MINVSRNAEYALIYAMICFPNNIMKIIFLFFGKSTTLEVHNNIDKKNKVRVKFKIHRIVAYISSLTNARVEYKRRILLLGEVK